MQFADTLLQATAYLHIGFCMITFPLMDDSIIFYFSVAANNVSLTFHIMCYFSLDLECSSFQDMHSYRKTIVPVSTSS